ncbi:DMT family transporter [Stagnihabitans tardus]|uniref:EamA family transporter n=1 Tax=Stagnihabitans tardus TaxID=2699202 RepID=A0AAE4YA50_9RHOB|nr:DMT family transporter [Stagnihabitans tardus]NBZ86275.1 EamA family transporter [Stagnihabitans tardus]
MNELKFKPLKAALFMALAVFLFSCMDVLTKHMAESFPAPFVVAARYAGNLVLLLALVAPREGKRIVHLGRPWLVILRGACLSAVSLTAALAFQRMPVAETIAVVFLAPFAVTLLAGPLLGEKVQPISWIAAAGGFVGVLMIVRPGSGLDPLGVLYAGLTAGGSIVYNMLSRSLARTETSWSMMFWTALVGTVIFSSVTLGQGAIPVPQGMDLVFLGAMGALSLVGHLLFTQAFRYAPASTISPVNYLQLVWSGILGLLVFGHMPDPWALAGMALIAVSGVSGALYPLIQPRFARKIGGLA